MSHLKKVAVRCLKRSGQAAVILEEIMRKIILPVFGLFCLLFSGCLPSGPTIQLSPATVLTAAEKGTPREDVQRSLGAPHERFLDDRMWAYIYTNQNKDKLRLDISFGHDGRVLNSTLKPCRDVRTGGQMEVSCKPI